MVCGGREHIETLHYSLRYLNHYSNSDILVLTDSARNEIAIDHHNVIDIPVSARYDHHQASIILKTSIHRYVPKGKVYCYLDTDVIALNTEVDQIFGNLQGPIRFAPDHCRVNKFSPQAVNCGCLERKIPYRKKLEKAWKGTRGRSSLEVERKTQLDREFERLKTDKLYKLLADIRYFFSGDRFNLNDQFSFDKASRKWMDRDGNVILLEWESDAQRIAKETGLTYDAVNEKWLDENGADIWVDECNHLIEAIRSDLGIEVAQHDWQHWNGGVFLFGDEGHDFLEAWHNKTVRMFDNDRWKTRDQGTLVATAWEFGLQDAIPLDKKWNFIADFDNRSFALNVETGEFTDDGFQTTVKPSFVHVYHHFGDTDWYVWNWVDSSLNT